MHIHGQLPNIQSADFYSIANAERAQRAAEVRKRLLKVSESVAGGASPEETLLIGNWLQAAPKAVTAEDEYREPAEGTEGDFR